MNNDGLYQKYGTTQATSNIAGEYHYDGPRHCIEIADLDLTKVTVTDGSYIVSDQVFFPKNARIETIELITETAATGTGAVLNLGLVKTDRSTEIDFNGFLAAFPQTSMTPAGSFTTFHEGSTDAGALFGTTTSTVGYICADYDTAAFTAGKVRIRIYYTMP
jgi:hypothetical protein